MGGFEEEGDMDQNSAQPSGAGDSVCRSGLQVPSCRGGLRDDDPMAS